MTSDEYTDGTERICLDLFAGLGGFSSAFKDADGWDVVTVDIEEDFDPDICVDVLELQPDDLPDADVILASPPCTDFSLACMVQKWDIDDTRRPRYLPKWESVATSIQIVFHTLWLVQELQPDYWLMENPRWGALRQFIGEPAGTVHYCQYGSDFKKPTGLWGVHPPMDYRTCPGESCDHVSNPSELNTFRDGTRKAARLGDVVDSAERAKVPYELSKSILEAVENPAPEQQTLVEVADGRNDHSVELDTDHRDEWIADQL